MCLTSLEVRAWLLVEASSGPGAAGGGGAEGGGAGDFHLERFSFSQFGACMLPHRMQALKPSTHREAWSGGGAFCWDGSLSPCWLTFPSSSHSHSVILTVISRIHCKSPGATFINLPGTPESQGPSPLQISGYPDQLWATPPGQPIILLVFPGPGRVVLPWCVYTLLCTYVCACVVYLLVCVCVCVCARAYVCMRTCVRSCVRARLCVCMCVCVCVERRRQEIYSKSGSWLLIVWGPEHQ